MKMRQVPSKSPFSCQINLVLKENKNKCKKKLFPKKLLEGIFLRSDHVMYNKVLRMMMIIIWATETQENKKKNKRKQSSLKNGILRCFIASSDYFMLFNVYLRLMMISVGLIWSKWPKINETEIWSLGRHGNVLSLF